MSIKDNFLKAISDDPFGLTVVKPKVSTNKDESKIVIEKFMKILEFYEKNKKEPSKEASREERTLAIILESIRNDKNQKAVVKELDIYDLVKNDKDNFELITDVDIEKIDVPSELLKDIENDLLGDKSEKTNAFISNLKDDKYYVISIHEGSALCAQLLKTKHKISGGGYALFDLRDESDGTRRIMDLIPLIIDFFKGGNVFVIDEMERSLHPNLVFDLFDFFLSKCKDINSQFIVSSHESTLLTQKLLRKDEIWFVVKDRFGASRLHSLEDYSIRFDKEVRRDYLLGRYKGVPKFGDRENLTVIPKFS